VSDPVVDKNPDSLIQKETFKNIQNLYQTRNDLTNSHLKKMGSYIDMNNDLQKIKSMAKTNKESFLLT
jgi:hypothetical protein